MALVEERQKVDRDEVFLEYTKSICPVCKAVVDAEVNIRDNRVLLRKRCPEHGRFEALVYSDAELYLRQQGFNKPGTFPLAFQTELKGGCPLDCGLCPEHKQHSCLGLIEVNTGCNLDCPICFADSGHQPDGYSLTREQVAFMLDAFVAAEGNPEVIQFSGGEGQGRHDGERGGDDPPLRRLPPRPPRGCVPAVRQPGPPYRLRPARAA